MLSKIYIKPTQEGWPEFTQKSPVKVKDLQGTNIEKFNEMLEKDIRDAGDRIQHKTAVKCHMTSQLILWPAWLYHSVPEHKCDHERIMAVGNLIVDWEKSLRPVTEHKLTPSPKGE